MLARIKGHSVYGEVLEVTDGKVNFRPLCPTAGLVVRHRAGDRLGLAQDGPPRRQR